MRIGKQFIAGLALLSLGAQGAIGQAPQLWIFEGLITESDPALAPELQSGWVLSGSFLFDSLQMKEQFIDQEGASGRYAGGISDGELTVDLYHQVLFEAVQKPGLAGFDFQDNNPEQDGRDLFGWFLPLDGQLGETGWQSTWLQVWLMDPEGDMIRRAPIQVSPYGIEWVSGWFRLTFIHQSGETAFADGRIEVFSPESAKDEFSGSQWRAIASDLSRLLRERDSTINMLEQELAEVKQRMDGLRKMVDLLVEERSSLQEDNALLRERAEAADPEVIGKVAELTAEKSLLQTHLDELSRKNDSLQDALQKSQKEKVELAGELQRLKSKEFAPQLPETETQTDLKPKPPVTNPSFQSVFPLPEENQIDDEIEPPIAAEPPADIDEQARDADSQDAEKTLFSTRKRGPRKFR